MPSMIKFFKNLHKKAERFLKKMTALWIFLSRSEEDADDGFDDSYCVFPSLRAPINQTLDRLLDKVLKKPCPKTVVQQKETLSPTLPQPIAYRLVYLPVKNG